MCVCVYQKIYRYKYFLASSWKRCRIKDKANSHECLVSGFGYYFPIKRDRAFLEKWLIPGLGQKNVHDEPRTKKERNQSTRVISKGIRNQVEEAPTGQRMGHFMTY